MEQVYHFRVQLREREGKNEVEGVLEVTQRVLWARVKRRLQTGP